MHTSATPAAGNPNPVGSPPTGSLNLRTAANYAIGAYAAITGSTGGGSIVNGNMFITPDNTSSVTNFPPSTYTGILQAANPAAVQAQIDATAAFTAGQTLGLAGTTLAAELGGTTVTPGAYQFTGGAAGISLTTGHSTLTFNGAGTYIFYTATTLTTGASGSTDLPTFAFTGGASATNTFIYWIVGSSATINQSVASSGATFYGTVIAQASVTATQAGTINGRLIALTGAVTLSNTNTINNPAASGGGGGIVVILNDNYNTYLGGTSGMVCPLSGTTITSGLTLGAPYVIVSLGSSTAAQWITAGLPGNITPAVGVSFIAAATSISGGGAVQAPFVSGSGIDHIEVIGDANLMNNSKAYIMSPATGTPPGTGMMLVLQCFANGVVTQPKDGTVIGLQFYMNKSDQGV
jgi:type VI secretion system secreted protein VgrG